MPGEAENSAAGKEKYIGVSSSNIRLIMGKTSLYILEFPCVGKGGNSVARSYSTHYSPILPLRELDCLKMR